MPLVLSLLVALFPALQDPPPRFAQEPVPLERRLSVSYLANQGFLLQSGETKVLIDAFVAEPHRGSEAVPPEVFDRMVEGEPPFDGYVLALTSHGHADHFQAAAAERFLARRDDAALITSPQVVRLLKRGAQDFSALATRVRSMPVSPGEAKKLVNPHMSVEFLRLPHGGEAASRIDNYGHLITMGGLRVLHLGDAAMDQELLAPLAEREVDILLVPWWFYTSEEGLAIIDELLHPRWAIACHVPTADKELFAERMALENPHVIVFREPLETKVFEPPPAGPAGDADDE